MLFNQVNKAGWEGSVAVHYRNTKTHFFHIEATYGLAVGRAEFSAEISIYIYINYWNGQLTNIWL